MPVSLLMSLNQIVDFLVTSTASASNKPLYPNYLGRRSEYIWAALDTCGLDRGHFLASRRSSAARSRATGTALSSDQVFSGEQHWHVTLPGAVVVLADACVSGQTQRPQLLYRRIGDGPASATVLLEGLLHDACVLTGLLCASANITSSELGFSIPLVNGKVDVVAFRASQISSGVQKNRYCAKTYMKHHSPTFSSRCFPLREAHDER